MTTGTVAEQAAKAEVDRWYAFRLVALFSLGWLVLTADVQIVSPLLPLIRSDFRLSGTEAGLITTAFYLPYLLMQVPAGILGDRLGPRRVLVIMTLLSGLALTGIGVLAASLLGLIVFAVLHRIGSGVYYPAAFGITVNSVPRSIRGISSSALSGGMALGSGVGLAIAVPIAERAGSWHAPFTVMGLATILIAVLIFLTVRSGQRISRDATKQSSGLRLALRDYRLWLLFAIGLCTNFGFTAVTVWGPSFLNSERGLALSEAGFYIALISFIGFPAGLLMGRLSDRIGRRWLVTTLFALAAVSVIVLATFPAMLVIIAAIVGYGITGKWAADGALAAWIGDLVTSNYPGAAASVYGFNNMCRMLGATLAPPIVGALLDYTGSLEFGLYVGAASLAIGAVFALLSHRI